MLLENWHHMVCVVLYPTCDIVGTYCYAVMMNWDIHKDRVDTHAVTLVSFLYFSDELYQYCNTAVIVGGYWWLFYQTISVDQFLCSFWGGKNDWWSPHCEHTSSSSHCWYGCSSCSPYCNHYTGSPGSGMLQNEGIQAIHHWQHVKTKWWDSTHTDAEKVSLSVIKHTNLNCRWQSLYHSARCLCQPKHCS